jgi:uncharacterized membrane protein
MEVFEHGTSPTAIDTDDDGLEDGREVSEGTDPTVADTDGDGLEDGREVSEGTDPTVADTDDDGLADGREISEETSPLTADTDGDGLTDGSEVELGSDPLNTDTDGDGLADGREVDLGSDPLNTDTDGDGLADGREVTQLGTSPTAADSDGDYLSDSVETTVGTNPTSELTTVWLSALLGTVASVGLLGGAIRRGHIVELVDTVQTLQLVFIRNNGTGVDVAEDGPESAERAPSSAEAVFEERSESSLVTDSELVSEMLAAEDGRMKQSRFVEITDWSKAKVSRLLSKKAEADDLVKIRLGRENLICLEHAQPAAVTSDPRSGNGMAPSDGGVPSSI